MDWAPYKQMRVPPVKETKVSPCIAGIGSRKTPTAVLATMEAIGKWCRENNWWVRSGHAPGADLAFEQGALDNTIVYLPWPGFNGPCLTRYAISLDRVRREVRAKAQRSVNYFHPNPSALSGTGYRFMCRNYFQIFGTKIEPNPVSAVVCWTPGGTGGGGTGQAIRIARHHKIPVIDLGNTGQSDLFSSPGPYTVDEIIKYLKSIVVPA